MGQETLKFQELVRQCDVKTAVTRERLEVAVAVMLQHCTNRHDIMALVRALAMMTVEVAFSSVADGELDIGATREDLCDTVRETWEVAAMILDRAVAAAKASGQPIDEGILERSKRVRPDPEWAARVEERSRGVCEDCEQCTQHDHCRLPMAVDWRERHGKESVVAEEPERDNLDALLRMVNAQGGES